MNEIKLSKDFIVTLHNDLIQARFSGGLSMMEQKILFTVLSNIEPPEQEVVNGERIIKNPIKEVKPFIVPLQEFTRFLEIEDPNYTYFKTVTTKLMEKVIYIEQDNGDWEMFHWVDYAKYQKNEGTIQIKISPHLYPYLLNLDGNFTKTKLGVLFSFKSVYSARIYQLAKKWSKIGKYKIELEELKDLIGVPVLRVRGGVKEFKLGKYNNFKQRALEVALKEINEHSEFELSIIEHKTARKITAITFIIEKKSSPTKNKKVQKKKEGKQLENKGFSLDFLNKYEYHQGKRVYQVKKTGEDILFDGRERATAILLDNKFQALDDESLSKMEEIITEILEDENFDVINEMYFLFKYTEHAKTIENPNAFIVSVLMKIKKEILKGNSHVKVTDFVNVRNNNIDMNIPSWSFDHLKSKKEDDIEKEISSELNKLEGTNITLAEIRFIELMYSIHDDKQMESKKDKKGQVENYNEYDRLKESGMLEGIISKKKEDLIEKGLWDNETDDIKNNAVEIVQKERKNLLVKV